VTKSGGGRLQERVASRARFIKAARCGTIRVTMAAFALAALASTAAPPLRAQVAPDQAWRTITTEHFRVTFPQGLEWLGRRAGARAERAYGLLSEHFSSPPKSKIDLLVTDATDFSNGYTSVAPTDRITVTARPPVDDLDLGYFDDWMELVVTHELTHVFHLDRNGAWGEILRPIFGRVPSTFPYFPADAVPRWDTEGTAVWYESLLSHAGRVKGTYHEMVVRTAVLEHRFEDLDQAAGDSPVWPGGNRYYIYGSMFFKHLMDDQGGEKLDTFANAVAHQWIPYRLNAAGKDAFGVSLTQEWGRWKRDLEARYADLDTRLSQLGPLTRGERLTPGARYDLYPSVSPDGTRLAFSMADGRTDTQIRVTGLDATGGRELTRTNGVATFDWMPDGGLLFSQAEYEGPYRTYEDLYRMEPGGRVVRLTHGERVSEPSVGPDGTWAVALEDGGGTNRLVRVDLMSGALRTLVESAPDVLWTEPAVSPDGRWIAVSRWTPGAWLDVVILDRSGSVVAEVTHDRAMDLLPTWSPDGRTLLWSSDRTGIVNVLAASIDSTSGRAGPVRLVTNVETGASYPSVDPSGTWLYYSGYHADGWEIERLPYQPDTWPLAPPARASFDAPTRPDTIQDAEVGGPVQGYSPFPTLLPHYWKPLYREPVRTPAVHTNNLDVPGREVLGAGLGFETAATDLVGRHHFDAYGRVFTKGGKWEGGASYSWAGLGNPVFSVGLDQSWNQDGVRLGQSQAGVPPDTLFALQRDRTLSGAISLYRSRWRNAASATLSGGFTWEREELLNNDLSPSVLYRPYRPERHFGDAALTLVYSTVRTHNFQLGAAQGVRLWVQGRVRREVNLPDTLVGVAHYDGERNEVLAQLTAFQPLGGPGYSEHVAALRVGVGYATGAGADQGRYFVGGASGNPRTLAGVNLFGGSPLFLPVRGYVNGDRFGSIAWAASAEYRFPLLLVHQGLDAWPLSVDRIQGTLFGDAGNAWGPELGIPGYQNPRRTTLLSVGGELTTDVLTFWTASLLVRTGVAFPLVDRSGAQVYLRLGYSF